VKKISLSLLTGAILVAFAACSGGGSTTDQSTTSAVTTSTSPVPPVSTTVDPETTAPAEPAPPATATEYGVGGPDDMPPIPTQVEGYVPWEGPKSETFRLFEDQAYGTPSDFRGQMNKCSSAFWVARWRLMNPDVFVVGGRLPYDADMTEYDTDFVEGHGPSNAGYITGFICERPIFMWGSSNNGANLVDIAIEWQYYDFSVESGSQASTTGKKIDCGSLRPNEELPLAPCDKGYGVLRAQQALVDAGYSLDADSYFGQETYDAVVQFQKENGLETDGYIGVETWKALLPMLPGYDLNDNGVIDPGEIGD